jgi:hypothetical protein
MWRGLALVAALALAPGVAEAGKNKVQHSNVVAPTYAGQADPGVGVVTALISAGDTFYVAGQNGVAAMGADGAVKWKVDLAPVLVRNIEVDDQGVAFTAYSIKDIDPATGFAKWAGGGLGDVLSYDKASTGVITLDGQLTWQVDSSEQTALSVPGMSAKSIAVMRGITMVVYDRADGHELGVADVDMATLGMKMVQGMLSQAPRAQPVAIGDRWYSSYMGVVWEVDASNGKLLDKSVMAGLTAYVDVTCGPVAIGDNLVFGTTGDTQTPNFYFGLKPEKLKSDWKLASPDIQSGCGSIVPTGDGGAIVASNFFVFKLDAKKGKAVWTSVNKKGGLYPSSYRGVRYVNGWFGVRKSWGDLVVTDGKKVYVGTSNKSKDVVTVLDAATGAYVQTISVEAPIVSMAVAGGKLAIATESDVRMVAAQ